MTPAELAEATARNRRKPSDKAGGRAAFPEPETGTIPPFRNVAPGPIPTANARVREKPSRGRSGKPRRRPQPVQEDACGGRGRGTTVTRPDRPGVLPAKQWTDMPHSGSAHRAGRATEIDQADPACHAETVAPACRPRATWMTWQTTDRGPRRTGRCQSRYPVAARCLPTTRTRIDFPPIALPCRFRTWFMQPAVHEAHLARHLGRTWAILAQADSVDRDQANWTIAFDAWRSASPSRAEDLTQMRVMFFPCSRA